MALSVKRLPRKHEDLSLLIRISVKIQGIMANICNLGTENPETKKIPGTNRPVIGRLLRDPFSKVS